MNVIKLSDMSVLGMLARYRDGSRSLIDLVSDDLKPVAEALLEGRQLKGREGELLEFLRGWAEEQELTRGANSAAADKQPKVPAARLAESARP